MAVKPRLSRRESEVMDVLFRAAPATAREVWSALGETRTYSTIRKLLSILEEKGHVTHRKEGAAFVYSPRQRRETAARSALSRVVHTFFDGSVESAVTSLLGPDADLSADELERIGEMIEAAKSNRKNGKGQAS
ncbi:MAG: BlaI/MecI/CopY family transcriptional regulator [Verrucomicrobiales bacterium]|nr:BlaI/MecI/CopY family transcriptional regulator [Verrucomicrobiales bacterium]